MMKFLLILSICLVACTAIRDSLNFVLGPGRRDCYYEDFDSSNPGRTIESFIQSVGDIDVLLTVHGPLSLDEIRSVSSYMLSLVRCCSLDKRHCVYNHVWIG